MVSRMAKDMIICSTHNLWRTILNSSYLVEMIPSAWKTVGCFNQSSLYSLHF